MSVKHRLLLVLAALFAALFVGCSAPQIAVESVSAPVLDGFTAVSGQITVRSDYRRTLVVREVRVVVRYGDRQLCTARLAEPIQVQGRTTTSVNYRFDIEDVDLGAALALGARAMADPDALMLDVDARARLGCLRKCIVRKNLKISELNNLYKR